MNIPRILIRRPLAAAALSFTLAAAMAPSVRAADTVAFNAGNPWAQVTGKLSKTEHEHDYTVGAKAGKTLQINIVSKNPNIYFRVQPSDSRTALIDTGKTGDMTWASKPDADATYTIHVYVDPDATPSTEQIPYALQVGIY